MIVGLFAFGVLISFVIAAAVVLVKRTFGEAP
jgi:hypothetical protein